MNNKGIKEHYIEGFGIAVIVLALGRCAFPGIATTDNLSEKQSESDSTIVATDNDDVKDDSSATIKMTASNFADNNKNASVTENVDAASLKYYNHTLEYGEKPHPIRSVHSFKECFPDTNSVQLAAAQRWGVKPVKNREDAEQRKTELVYIGASPYYHVDPLRQSIPYMVPRAAILLEDIGRAFYDSLSVKGVPLHKIIITSVLRTQEDVMKLRRYNGNATENSCHLYGTTLDICYNRYKTVEDPDGPARRVVRNDTLKYILSEVLRDMRKNERCYIKYEVKQGCFHLTVR